MTNAEKTIVATLKRIIADAESIRPKSEDAPDYYFVGSIVANAEDMIEAIESDARERSVKSWETGFLGALASGNFTINGKKVAK